VAKLCRGVCGDTRFLIPAAWAAARTARQSWRADSGSTGLRPGNSQPPSRLSTMREVFSWLQDKKDFAVGPRIDDDSFAPYMNRFTEIAWMTLRSLPFLQTDSIGFTDEWRHEWEVLDDSLRVSVEGLGSLGKKIAPAFIAMIEQKFDTSPASRYVERGYA
jgi:hypothetical protein